VTKKRWIAAISALGILIAAALTTAAVVNHGGGRSAEDDSPLVAPSTTSSSSARTTTTHRTTTTVDLAKLPHPDPPPADPYAAVPVVQIGSIEIPKIGLLHPVFEGITLTVIDHGPGHWPGSALPCQVGNTVFPGHRVTHTHPFLNLDLLSPGDRITFHMPKEDCVYSVTGTQIVKPTDVWVTDPTTTPTVTLIACHPKHSAAERIVVKGKLIADIPRSP
jgi:sortase A